MEEAKYIVVVEDSNGEMVYATGCHTYQFAMAVGNRKEFDGMHYFVYNMENPRDEAEWYIKSVGFEEFLLWAYEDMQFTLRDGEGYDLDHLLLGMEILGDYIDKYQENDYVR